MPLALGQPGDPAVPVAFNILPTPRPKPPSSPPRPYAKLGDADAPGDAPPSMPSARPPRRRYKEGKQYATLNDENATPNDVNRQIDQELSRSKAEWLRPQTPQENLPPRAPLNPPPPTDERVSTWRSQERLGRPPTPAPGSGSSRRLSRGRAPEVQQSFERPGSRGGSRSRLWAECFSSENGMDGVAPQTDLDGPSRTTPREGRGGAPRVPRVPLGDNPLPPLPGSGAEPGTPRHRQALFEAQSAMETARKNIEQNAGFRERSPAPVQKLLTPRGSRGPADMQQTQSGLLTPRGATARLSAAANVALSYRAPDAPALAGATATQKPAGAPTAQAPSLPDLQKYM